MTDLTRLGAGAELDAVWPRLLPHLLRHLDFDNAKTERGDDELPAIAVLKAG